MEKWLKLYAVGLYTFLAERLSSVTLVHPTQTV